VRMPGQLSAGATRRHANGLEPALTMHQCDPPPEMNEMTQAANRTRLPIVELSLQFRFEAAHTLQRDIDCEPSRRIHGHSYRAEVTLRGPADPQSGMLVDMGHFRSAISDAAHGLDHRLLDEVAGLGPATLENLSTWIWHKVSQTCPNLTRVTVYRDSEGQACSYLGDGRG
jgi:6-pyruvoyltetrahydropterin/6-carboxytetrahydropterin synthase